MDDRIGARLEALRQRYAEALPQRIREIAEAARPVFGPDHAADAATEAARFAHNLAGTGDTFGFGPLGDAARVVEDALRAYRDQGRPPSSNELDELRAAFTSLFDVARQSGIDDLPSLEP